MISTIRRVWAWLSANRQIEGWETFRRSDLEAWLQARCQDGVSQNTIDYNLGLVRMLLRFVEARGCHLDPGLFRAESPKKRRVSLPRYLPDEGRVFVLHQRSPTPRTIQRRLRKYGTKAGVDVSPHKLRHTMATRLLNQGMPIHSLRKLLGHQHLNTTQIYARLYDQTLYRQFREATARLEGLAVDGWPQTITGAPLRAEKEVAEALDT